MTMKFYDALQLDPSILKRKIAASNARREKTYYWLAIAVRSVLIVGLCHRVYQPVVRGVWGRQYAAGGGAVLHDAGHPLCQF